MDGTLVHFDDRAELPPIKAVGGKGYSLIRMRREGLPVPPGFVLTVDFFEPWTAAITASKLWREFLDAPPEEMTARAAVLPSLADDLSFDKQQSKLVGEALQQLEEFSLFAVRSSSPEEDLAGASFAGGYETILGASRDTLETAVRQAYASCLEPRVFVYKRQQGFEINQALIAIVVQAQIASEIAGVGFSVAPISNDYDHAVFNSNWGLGETVVSGLASPDQYIIDKVSGEVVESLVGTKETSIWLLPDGGTKEEPDKRHDQSTLDSVKLAEMTRQLVRIEKIYGQPMDTEWAWQGDNFYLLQARPITAFLPLPEELVTAPGERRRLYLDATLSVQGIQEPLSVMGEDFLNLLFAQFSTKILGDGKLVSPDEGLVQFVGQRMYIVLSHMFHLVESRKLGSAMSMMDSLVGEILLQIDPNTYISEPPPGYLKHFVPRILSHVPGLPLRGLETLLVPEHRAAVYHRNVDKVLNKIDAEDGAPSGTQPYAGWLVQQFVQLVVITLIPPLMAAMAGRSKLKGLFEELAQTDPETADDLLHIDQALPHNVTIEMGMALYSIAESLAGQKISDSAELGRRLNGADLPPETQQAWQSFMERFGFRGPMELDIAAPRYQDKPELLYNQIYSLMGLAAGQDNPRAIQARSVERREQAHERLKRKAHAMSMLKGKEYDLLYRLLEHFGGYRENHKYYLVKIVAIMRRRVLEQAATLVAEGRLDRAEQVFDLKFDDLDRATNDPKLDLRGLISRNTEFLRKLDHVNEFPHVVDSRGRILRPPQPEPKPGELAGQPISPGVVQGPVKVLHTPDEKPLLPGDILVARATDPGWTPLFVNAGAIVLEVGGMLQHGSLVAREYGKPCVAGVQNATTRLKDGTVVEIDGSAGIIRVVDGE